MDVTIVIRTKNEEKSLERTLRRVEEQEFSGRYEVVIVDSGSTDSTLDITKKYDVRLVQIPEMEFTYGRSLNIGADHAKGQFVVNLSAHALPLNKKWLTNLSAGFDGPDRAGVYGKQISIGQVNPFEALRNEVFFGDKERTFNTNNKRLLRQIHFSNGNSAVRKDIWREFKFDEEVPYAEDLLWQRDVVEAGFSISYAPDAAVYHTHEIDIRDAYKYSRDCSYTLARMKNKRKSILGMIYDLAVLVAFVPRAMFENVKYIWANRYWEHLGIAPIYVLAGWCGWLVGRAEHRLRKP